jgi:hypothetical protein
MNEPQKPQLENKEKQTAVRKEPDKFSRIISILSVVISVFALFFAWQANQIAKRQFTEQLIWIDSRFDSNTHNLKDSTSCAYRIYLTNNGGSPASITNFDSLLLSNGLELKVEGFGKAFNYYGIDNQKDKNKLTQMLTGYHIGLYKTYYRHDPSKNEFVTFPLIINPGETEMFILAVDLDFDSTKVNEFGFLPVGDYPNPWFSRLNEIYENYSSLDISIIFYLSSGRKISIPKVPVIFYK